MRLDAVIEAEALRSSQRAGILKASFRTSMPASRNFRSAHSTDARLAADPVVRPPMVSVSSSRSEAIGVPLISAETSRDGSRASGPSCV